MDFYQITVTEGKKYDIVSPSFKADRSKDLMIRGGNFYAIWDEEKNLWSTDEYDVPRLVDMDLENYAKTIEANNDKSLYIRRMTDFSSKVLKDFKTYIKHVGDNYHQLDEELTFSNDEIKKKSFVSRTLPYPLEEGSIEAYDELMSTLYDPEERAKLEWAIGAIVAGDAKYIQKFIVLYGEAGSGKSTFLNIVQKLFVGYYSMFEAKAIGSNNNTFATEVFKNNPLVAIQHDGDLSKIEDNTKLNSIISHEEMTMNEKYKAAYDARVNAFLFMGTNNPIKITNSKSGIIRRLIDVHPSLRKIPSKRYHIIMSRIDFELGAIAYHCLQVYRSMGKNYYASYRPLEMMLQTDVFFNFIESNYPIFLEQEGITAKQAFEMYKQYCEETLVEYKMPYYKFREELKSYFKEFKDITRVDGKQIRSYYSGFLTEKFNQSSPLQEEPPSSFTLDSQNSILDDVLSDCPAQYATADEVPGKRWVKVTTTLKDIRSTEIHYVKPGENHIVIDFDLKDETGSKSVERNLEEASKWPATYAEFSKSGAGIHLHYFYDGDVTKLANVYTEGIEIKTFTDGSSLRRRLTKCNTTPVATMKSGYLPLKGEKKVLNFEGTQTEKGLRTSIEKALRKEVHPGTKSNIDFIHHILEEAYNGGLNYDVTDMRPKILAFANNSTNQSEYCVKLVSKMRFKSEEVSIAQDSDYSNDMLIFFDVEVFKNLFLVVWKKEGEGNFVRMINPTPQEIEPLFKFKLIGFNCRNYDNHILYARYIGYTNEQLYELSDKIINSDSNNAKFSEAYNISYADVHEFSSKNQSLKKWEIELGIHHQELDHPWDEPLPEDKWETAIEYCCNDVAATEAVFHARKADFVARQILADLSGLPINSKTNSHSERIIFGHDKNPQDKFIYTNLSETFPGYKYENGVSTYMDEFPGEGGYVYAEPGMYSDVAILDVASMHPSSLIALNAFGDEYTHNFKQLMDARLAIKHKEYDSLANIFNGALTKYMGSDQEMADLSYALKIVINSVYGLTSATYNNKFKDPRNIDNIVAKRGALFMIDLKIAVQERGFTVAHIKTDSIKIPNATPEIIDFVCELGKKYGYTFEHEATYDRLCLVNDAVYVARYKDGKKAGKWTTVGAQFSQPYVFKSLFKDGFITAHETPCSGPIELKDVCETLTVTTALYLDMNEQLSEDEHNYHFVGKAGSFCPVLPGAGGGMLVREKDGKYYAAGGSKGYRWLEAEVVKNLGKESDIDVSYYEKLVDTAIKDISKFGDFEWFVSDETTIPKDTPPWECPSGKYDCVNCDGECKKYSSKNDEY